MHIPDGVLKPAVWAPLAAVSVVSVAVASAAARKRLEDQSIPLIGVMGAFVFAIMMLNFPIAAGISDHIVGGALLAIVLGPSVAVVSMAAIVTIQALIFRDGGIAALGANVFNMAIVSTLVSYLIYRALARALPRASVVIGTFLGVMAAATCAAAWVMLSQPYGLKFFLAMELTHAVSGAVEAVVTLAVVKALRAWDLDRSRREAANADSHTESDAPHGDHRLLPAPAVV